jgi:ketosteroid isomerase-like protein
MVDKPVTEPRINPESDGSMHTERSSGAIVRALLDHLNTHDRQGFMSLLTPDAVQVEPAAELKFRGPSDITANFWSYRSTFPDLHVAVTNLFACGNHAVAELTLRGTYEPYTYGRRARAISWYGCLVMEIEGDKVARIALYADRLNMLDQLGALPLAPEAPSANPHGYYYRRLEPVVPAPAPSPAHHDENGQGTPSPSGKE